jgi:hypothetical protein
MSFEWFLITWLLAGLLAWLYAISPLNKGGTTLEITPFDAIMIAPYLMLGYVTLILVIVLTIIITNKERK